MVSSDFYPRSPCGERLKLQSKTVTPSEFLSTLSLRRATYKPGDFVWRYLDFYPRSPCGERRPGTGNGWSVPHFYPRSPCGERLHTNKTNGGTHYISIHALLAESDLCAFVSLFGVFLFLSTLSLRRATKKVTFVKLNNCYFYPRSPCGERLEKIRKLKSFVYFYPRSPCGERLRSSCKGISYFLFLSTLSLRRATT